MCSVSPSATCVLGLTQSTSLSSTCWRLISCRACAREICKQAPSRESKRGFGVVAKSFCVIITCITDHSFGFKDSFR